MSKQGSGPPKGHDDGDLPSFSRQQHLREEAGSKRRPNPLLGLAARIRSAAAEQAAEERRQEEARRQRAAQMEAALDRVFDELEEMGRAAEVLGVNRRGRSIRLSFAAREVVIASEPDESSPDQLKVSASQVTEELSGYYQAELGRFVLRISKPATELRPALSKDLILMGAGLTWLVENGLGLDVGAEA